MKYKNIKIILILVLFFLITILLIPNCSYADDDVLGTGMSEPSFSSAAAGVNDAINQVIGLIQIAGTGLAIVSVTMQGIKYIMASPSEKADIKKAAMPIVIGSVLLFGTVNIVKLIADAASDL